MCMPTCVTMSMWRQNDKTIYKNVFRMNLWVNVLPKIVIKLIKYKKNNAVFQIIVQSHLLLTIYIFFICFLIKFYLNICLNMNISWSVACINSESLLIYLRQVLSLNISDLWVVCFNFLPYNKNIYRSKTYIVVEIQAPVWRAVVVDLDFGVWSVDSMDSVTVRLV